MSLEYQVIQSPLVTEKSTTLRAERNQYSFFVHPRSNKIEIKKAIEELFKVKVLNVNTVKVGGKKRRLGKYQGYTSSRKKAIITLQAGDTIKVFEGV